jgi:hypothetical protein
LHARRVRVAPPQLLYRAVVTSDGRAIGGRGIALVVVGVALVVLSIGALQWYRVQPRVDVAGSGFTFRDLQQDADQLNAPVAAAYFNWLAFALGVALAVVGLLANVPLPGNGVLRVAGFLLGAAGAVATYYALAQLFYAQHAAGGSRHGVLHNASFGLWCCLAGFVVAGVGAALGPRPG